MNTEMQVFKFETNAIRTVEMDGEIWFVAKDVATTLGYKDTVNAVKSHCRKAKFLVELGWQATTPLNIDSQSKMIPESDVYRLTMKSTLKSAEKFQDWVTEEVLPSIRKTGRFSSSFDKVEVQQKKVQELKHQIFSLENEPLTLQGFSQLSLKDRKKQRSQIWEIWRKTNAISKELNWRRIQVAKSVNLIINGMTTYRFRRLTGLAGLARDWMPLANQFCFYLAEHDLLDLLRARDWDVDFAYVERVYPELARIAKSRVELMYEVELDSSIEEEVNRVLDFVRQQVQSNVTPYLQTEAQVLNYQHDLTHELERLESLLLEPKKVKLWTQRPLRKSA